MVSKLAWGIGWTFIKTLKNLKICVLMGSFSLKCNVSARKFQRNCTSWHRNMMQKLTENWLMAWKMTRNLVNFHVSSWKSENLHLMGSFCRKHKVLDEKVQKSYLLWQWSDVKFEEKLALGFKNDMTSLVNFNANSGKYENLHFDVLLLSIAYIKFQLKKCRRVVSHDTEEWSNLWRKTHFLF